jgi:hypothetical protein
VSGNTSSNPSGNGCSVADLCAVGSHVCAGAAEVAARSPTGCSNAALVPGLFFATRQSGTGCAVCSLGTNTDPTTCTSASCAMGCLQTMATANDLFGCGSLGLADSNCGALTRTSGNLCFSLGAPWSCQDDIGEALDVTKASSVGGGVLCCVN